MKCQPGERLLGAGRRGLSLRCCKLSETTGFVGRCSFESNNLHKDFDSFKMFSAPSRVVIYALLATVILSDLPRIDTGWCHQGSLDGSTPCCACRHARGHDSDAASGFRGTWPGELSSSLWKKVFGAFAHFAGRLFQHLQSRFQAEKFLRTVQFAHLQNTNVSASRSEQVCIHLRAICKNSTWVVICVLEEPVPSCSRTKLPLHEPAVG